VTEIREAVLAVVLEIGRQQRPDLTGVEPTNALGSDLGFDSLDLAQAAAELEIRLGLDPFARYPASRIITVGDLVELYERAAEKS
jgi:acyl carrier protein